ncbi:MAG TPA: polysaccharide biosynthesis C-terminal domain-containing protein [Ferruginibacter sp.]|nr:polysaccharide biosynthesis C-terminal domain-containing protein [Ferruginibacter sp.]HRO05603.1 polysaccharide biosynthesis C-terminal domain-containing protein [Ferruginibacter sp.]HRO97190.1 polysaccharide biosynthesis C-terminal domain-containing protein [Ferruginibacter sp.]HRP49353.1 polysaccharide biosynthesis C-terminal domain-containing protein [Ferruginibacter sp.]
MSQIRKRSLKAAVWIYAGFLIGAINTYFFTHKSWFTTDQNGLTRVMIDISILICGFSTLGVTTYLFKFFPYYKDNVEDRKNDILGLALIVAFVGFILTSIGLIAIEPIVVRKFSEKSILLVEYFYWCLPMACFILLYNILESYAYGYHEGVLTSLLKETVLRFYTLVIIVLKVLDIISFNTFIILFAFQYALIVIILAVYLKLKNQLWISFKISRVTIKYKKKIISVMGLTFIVAVVMVLRSSIDGIVLAAKQDLGKVGIFGLAAYMVSVMQAPFRSMVAVTIPILSRAWKSKDVKEINRIYKRSSINLLTFSLLVFFCIWLNFDQAIHYFGINPDYLEGKWVFFILGMVTMVEMGSGVNAQIIGTSVYWRFELWTSILLTALIIPLSYTLTVRYGIIGPAIANIISFTIYNYIRFHFLWKKFNMQPFSRKTVEVILVAVGAYFITYFALKSLNGLPALILNPLLFSGIFITMVYQLNISPDVKPILYSMKNRFLKRRQ